jgi:hypothetical protein
VLDTHEIAAALRQSLDRTQAQLRDGLLPGIKLPGGRWRMRREDLLAILAGQTPTPAQQRAELLGADTVAFLAELANAGPLTEAQQDVIRQAFRVGGGGST